MPDNYEVISADEINILCRLVNDAINEGYVPCGGIAVDSWEGGGAFYQAVYKPKEKNLNVSDRG
jgi:hypothetical protein